VERCHEAALRSAVALMTITAECRRRESEDGCIPDETNALAQEVLGATAGDGPHAAHVLAVLSGLLVDAWEDDASEHGLTLEELVQRYALRVEQRIAGVA